MRKVSELLLEDNVMEENKQLIIELATSLLKRAPMLTVNILGKQIITLGRLLTQIGSNNNDQNNNSNNANNNNNNHNDNTNSNSSLAMSAKTFLRTAFLKFARNGLFVLIFKVRNIITLWILSFIIVVILIYHYFIN